jgi:hypothetical protein
MDKRLRRKFLEVVTETVAKRAAESLRFHPAQNDEDIAVLTGMAKDLKEALKDMDRDVFGRAGLPSPIRNLQTVLYPHALPQVTVVSFMIGPKNYRIAAVKDDKNRPAFRGINTDTVTLLHGAKASAGVANIETAIFKNLVSMLSREGLNQLERSLAPQSPQHL